MTTITDLPNEILRKIFTSSDNLPTLQKVSNVCRTFKNLHLDRLIIPYRYEYTFEITDHQPSREKRIAMSKGADNNAKKYAKKHHISPFQYHAYDLIETISHITGNYTKYDSLYTIFDNGNMPRSPNWKILGYMNSCHYYRSNREKFKHSSQFRQYRTNLVRVSKTRSLNALI